MKKSCGLVIVLITLMTVNVSCQNIESKERAGRQQFNKMNQKLKSELDLYEKQEISWDEIYNNYRVRFKDLKTDENIDREVKKEKAKSLFAELDKEVLSILNPEQQKEYRSLVKKNRGMSKEKYQKRQAGNSGQSKGQNRGQNRGQNIKNELSLSEDQSEKWDNINADYRSKMQGIRNSSDLGSDAKRKDMENLMGEKDAEILAILDSSQQASYLQLVEERRAQANQKRGQAQ